MGKDTYIRVIIKESNVYIIETPEGEREKYLKTFFKTMVRYSRIAKHINAEI